MLQRIWKQILAAALLVGAVVLAAGCQSEVAQDEFLLAYSGDCQAYLDPCG